MRPSFYTAVLFLVSSAAVDGPGENVTFVEMGESVVRNPPAGGTGNPRVSIHKRSIKSKHKVSNGMAKMLENMVFMEQVDAPSEEEDFIAHAPEQGMTCPQAVKAQRETDDKEVKNKAENYQVESLSEVKVSDEFGNCECPDGEVCLMTELMRQLTSIGDELGYESKTIESLEDLTNTMKAQLGCPARSKDKLHWYTSLKYFSWRSTGVACYNMRPGDELKKIVLYTDENDIVRAKSGVQNSSSSFPVFGHVRPLIVLLMMLF